LGVNDFDTAPDGKNDDKIKMDVFLREAYVFTLCLFNFLIN
jgi:hypothetical protein